MLIALLLSFIYATYYILLRRLHTAVSPFLLGTCFRIICLLLYGLSFAIRGQGRALVSENVRKMLPWLLFIATMNFLMETAVIVGLGLTTALNAALLSRLDILFAIIIGAVLFHERPRRTDLWGIALLSGGCLAVLNVRLSGIQGHIAGDALIVAAGLLLAINAFVIRFKLAGLHPDVIAFHNVLYSTVPFALASRWETRVFIVTPINLALITLLGGVVFGSYVTYYAALRSMPVWRVRSLLLIVPTLVLFVGAAVLQDPITRLQVFGAVLVMAGEALVLISLRRAARRVQAPAAELSSSI